MLAVEDPHIVGGTIMMSFRGNFLSRLTLPVSSVWLVGDIAEAKGRQDLYTRQSPQLLKALRETALIQSVESSNRIEGITVAPARLRPLVLENAAPKDRSEEEIRGYRRALDLIHTRARDLEISPLLLQRLHALVQEGSGDAGQWKQVENELVEFREGVAPIVRFRPVTAAEAPSAVEGALPFLSSYYQSGIGAIAPGHCCPRFRLSLHPPLSGWQRPDLPASYATRPLPTRLRSGTIHQPRTLDRRIAP